MVICLDGNIRGYQKSMMMQLLLLMYQKKNESPQWKMLVGSVSVYNEEAGESSFSVLSRVCLGDTLKSDFKHMDKMYQLTRQYSVLSDSIQDEKGRSKRENGFLLLTDRLTEVLCSLVHA